MTPDRRDPAQQRKVQRVGTQSFSTDDFDEASAIYSRLFYESQVTPAAGKRAAFRLDMKVDATRAMTFATINHRCETRSNVGGFDMTYSVAVSLKGSFGFRIHNQHLAADQLTAVVASPTDYLTARGFPTGYERVFVLAMGNEYLESHLCKLLGRERVSEIKLSPSLDLREGFGAQWWQLTSTLVSALDSPQSMVSSPLIETQLSEAVMTGLLLAADHPYRDLLDAWTRPIPNSAVRKAKEIIESRAHEPLTVPEIAAEVGCSVRALQSGYRKHLNMTPQEHLGRVRMDHAHALLRSGNPNTTTVAAILATAGFRHPGRFAADYRKAYGVPPHVTLRDR